MPNTNLRSRLRAATIILALSLVLGACQSAESEPVIPAADTAAAAQSATTLNSGWQAVEPGGETTCSDGSAYKFFVRAGDPAKVMVYMQGGGACWFRQNCDPQMQPSYNINIGDWAPTSTGIFNFAHPANPFADYSVVMAPYCTGDVHLGAKDTVYPPVQEGQTPLTIRHQGRTNMQAVLDWTYRNLPNPERIFVTGSSAGAIPSPFYASMLADHYPDARVAQLGDGAGGYRRINQDTRPDQQWGTFSFLNEQRGFENEPAQGFNYERLYIAAAKAHPNILFAEFDNAEDRVQKQFLTLGGSQTESLLSALQANHEDIRAEVDNFRAFIAGGEAHTVLRRPEFYTTAADGVSIRDWVARLAEFSSVEDRTCDPCAVAETIASSTTEQTVN